LADPTDRAVAENLARELSRLGHRVCLVGPCRSNGEPFQGVSEGIPIYRVGGGGASEELAVRQLLRIDSQEGIDVWHCHVFGRSHRALARAARRGGWPLLLTLHLVLEDYLPFLGGKAGLRSLLGAACHVTAVSRAARQEFLESFPEWRKRSSVVYNGPRPPAAELPIPRAVPRPYILCVARLAPYKGQDLLLMAWARMSGECPGWSLVLCGRDQTRGGLRRLVRALGLQDSVILTGDLPPPQVDGLLRDCEFFVLPSRRENFPLAVLEAMRAGKAVIASAAGGTGEMLRDGIDGLLAPPCDVDALSRLMLELSRDCALRRRLGRRALSASRKFSWRRAAAAYARLYRRAAPSRRRAAGMRSKK